MYRTLKILSLLFCISALTGCSYLTKSQTFRNRTFDYTQQNVKNMSAPLQTPTGMATPQFNAQLSIPPGQNDYPPGNPPNMTPPGYDNKVTIPPLPPKTKGTSTSNS